MKPLLLILALAFSVSAQDIKEIEKIKNWKLIKEMSGEVPNHPGLTVEFRAAEIARGDDVVKLIWRMDFPWGSPGDLLKEHVPHGFDPTSISRVESRVELNCKTHVVNPVTNSADVYQFNGKQHKSKEQPFSVKSWDIFFTYFCEQGEAPTKAPTLKLKP